MKPLAKPPLRYFQNRLSLEDMPLDSLVRRFGTPLYVYSAGEMEQRYRRFDRAFASVPHRICYAVKANSNLQILRLFRRLGSGFDIVSGGELFRVLKSGAPAAQVVFSGVGKTAGEMDYALSHGVGQFNIESVGELSLLEARACALRRTVRASLRINPDVNPRTHPYIATGLREHKFGVDMRFLPEIVRAARSFKQVRLEGLGFHIGSQILEVLPFADAAKILAKQVTRMREAGFTIATLDLGGGLGIAYKNERAPQPEDLARGVLPALAPLGCELLFEPGRWLVGRAGTLITRVLFTKKNGRKRFVVVDAGMNDLLRPSLYQAYHEILPVIRQARAKTIRADVVGPICETGDFFARDRALPEVGAGDLMAVADAGAYGFSLASNYNSRPRSAEVLVTRSKAKLIRRRESYDDLTRGEPLR